MLRKQNNLFFICKNVKLEIIILYYGISLLVPCKLTNKNNKIQKKKKTMLRHLFKYLYLKSIALHFDDSLKFVTEVCH